MPDEKSIDINIDKLFAAIKRSLDNLDADHTIGRSKTLLGIIDGVEIQLKVTRYKSDSLLGRAGNGKVITSK